MLQAQVVGIFARSCADALALIVPECGHKIAQQGVRRLLAVGQRGIGAVQGGKACVNRRNGAKEILHGLPYVLLKMKKAFLCFIN